MEITSHIPYYIPAMLTVALGLTFVFLAKALISTKHKYSVQITTGALVLLAVWAGVQNGLSMSGFYSDFGAMPPRFPLVVTPVILIEIVLLISFPHFFERMSLSALTWIHIVRVPVEIMLYGLFTSKLIPIEMTFEGRNFDIVMGLTAPLVAYYGVYKGKFEHIFILVWNLIGLFLLLNIVITAILSFPYPFQKFGFDQPNRALVMSPYILLPAVIVPTVLFAHLAAVMQLMKTEGK